MEIVKSPPEFPNSFEIRSGKENVRKERADLIDFLFSTAWVPRFVVRYFRKTSDTKEALTTRWSLWKLVEYQENTTAGQPGFEPGIDTIVSTQHLYLHLWDEITITTNTNSEGATIHKVCSQITNSPPEVRLCVFFVDRKTISNSTAGESQDPNFVKWFFSVKNYPYVGLNSRLAIKVGFDTKFLVKDLSGDDTPVNSTTTNGLALGGATSDNDPHVRSLISWVTNVDVTGNSCSSNANVSRSVVYDAQVTADMDVLPTNDPDTLDATFHLRVCYFSFLTDCFNPTEIKWDPDMGVVGSGLQVSFSLCLIALILVATLF